MVSMVKGAGEARKGIGCDKFGSESGIRVAVVTKEREKVIENFELSSRI